MYHLYRYDNELLEAAAIALKMTLPRYMCVHACMYMRVCMLSVVNCVGMTHHFLAILSCECHLSADGFVFPSR